MMKDFGEALPVADIRIGRKQHLRVLGFAESYVGLPLVELRGRCREFDGCLRLTVDQAEMLSRALAAAAAKARK